MGAHRGLLITEKYQKKLGTPCDVEAYEPGEGEVLIRNESVAQNPLDWKQVDRDFRIPPLPAIVGVDTAGVVEKIGKGVTNVKLGDRVFTMRGAWDTRHATYQTHSIGRATITVQIPDTLSFDNAATFPLAYFTAASGLFYYLRVPIPLEQSDKLVRKFNGEPLVVWGGSSSVGAMVIQLAAISGFKVVATASPKNFEYVKSLGAMEVIDYKDPEVVAKIKAVSPHLKLAFDAANAHGSKEALIKCMPSAGSIATIDTRVKEDQLQDIKVVGIIIPIHTDVEFEKASVSLLKLLLQEGKLIPHPVKIMPNGLNSVDEGWQLMREGKVSAQKLIYHPQEE